MPTLFSRKPAAESTASTTVSTTGVATDARTKSYTPSKKELGVVTPKRGTTNPRRATAAVPTDPKAAREARRKQRQTDYQARLNGEEYALLPRDKGPERRLVRDTVDARRNLGSYLLGTMFLSVLFGLTRNVQLALIGNGVFYAMVVVAVVDSYFLSRRIRAAFAEKMPNATPQWRRLYWYGAVRALMFRGMRQPRPKVKIGGAPV